MSNIAFIGLGTMGLPMARNLIEKGHQVTGFDISSEALAHHAANGGITAANAAEACRGAEFVITMVPNAGHVRAALFGEVGILAGIDPAAIFIEMSTIHPLETDAIRAELAGQGITMVDAPVGRTSVNAQTGTLLIMVGAKTEDLERTRPIFECLGDTIIDCGGPGMGSRMKIINNFMSVCLNALTAEALTLTEAVGLNRDKAIEVMTGTLAGRGFLTTAYPAKPFKGDLSPAFMLDLAHKDLGLALDLAAAINVPLVVGAAARELYTIARGQGRGQQDWTAIYPMLRGLANLSGDEPVLGDDVEE
ncbi:MAG: sulfolactaldehyde 3-reductase [Anaerolineae bacterium]|nr:sulfolactaldehyde 3-reductase [Anaerolineae bacterium]